MNLGNLKYFVMLALTILGAQKAVAAPACHKLEFTAQPALIDLNTQSMTPITLTITRDSSASGDCAFFVTGDNVTYGTFSNRKVRHGGDFVPFQMYLDAGKTRIFKTIGEALSSSEVLSGTLTDANPTKTVEYYPWVDTAAPAVAAPYLERYFFYLYAGTFGVGSPGAPKDSESTNMKYDKGGGFVELSLVNTGAVYDPSDVTQTINFPSLATGVNSSFDVMLKYNTGYKLSMSSTNGSNIRNGTRNIPYTVTLNGSPISVTSGVPVRTHANDGGATTSPSLGLRLPMAVTIGNIGTSPAGTYTDTVSITVAVP